MAPWQKGLCNGLQSRFIPVRVWSVPPYRYFGYVAQPGRAEAWRALCPWFKSKRSHHNLRSSNGRTMGFGPVNLGSSPSWRTIYILSKMCYYSIVCSLSIVVMHRPCKSERSVQFWQGAPLGWMAELVDALVLGTSLFGGEGSNPSSPTILGISSVG